MTTRIEIDAIGPVEIASDAYWGTQTQRALNYFAIGENVMPMLVIVNLVIIKKAAALVNHELGLLTEEKKDLMVRACDEILCGKYQNCFPLPVWQTGSGTQSNMNVNEVIANVANSLAGHKLGGNYPIHPNDDVNKCQSSNDVFPTAMHMAAVSAMNAKLLPALYGLSKELCKKQEEFAKILKIGRTHLMDAVPMTVGQEFSGYHSQLESAISFLQSSLPALLELAIGGTAIGTGLNAPKNFGQKMVEKLNTLTQNFFTLAKNPFAAIAAHDALVNASGALKTLACALIKIADDIALLGSGPRCGLGEFILPANEPGSSIMPGKVNPTQCEALAMVCTHVIGNDATIAFAGSHGRFELNTYKPVMIFSLLNSVNLLGDACASFSNHLLRDLKINTRKTRFYLENSLMIATALNPIIGYEKTASLIKKSLEEGKSLRDACMEGNYLDVAIFDKVINDAIGELL